MIAKSNSLTSSGHIVRSAVMMFAAFLCLGTAFAQPFTHSPNSFQSIQTAANKIGFTFTGGHQFSSTLPVVAIIMTFMMWNWWSVYIAGELKSAGKLRRQLSIMIGALVWDSLFMIIGVLLLYRTASEPFVASINALAKRTSTVYDEAGRAKATVDPLSNRTSSVYVNALRRRRTHVGDHRCAAGANDLRLRRGRRADSVH